MLLEGQFKNSSMRIFLSSFSVHSTIHADVPLKRHSGTVHTGEIWQAAAEIFSFLENSDVVGNIYNIPEEFPQ